MTGSTTALAGRRAIVTGAAMGLGRAFARACAEAGATVSACDLDPAVQSLEAELDGRAGLLAVADVADPEAVRSFVAAAAARMGGIDLLVNNAGVVRQTSPLDDPWEKALEDYDAVVGVNFRGCFLAGRAAIPHLARQGGDIVNVGTDHVHTCGYPVEVEHGEGSECRWAGARRPPLGGPRYDLYDASKWALKGLTNVWAAALAEHGVRVNSFGMGATDTPLIRAHLEAKGAPPPAGMLDPDQVAAVLIELLAEGPRGRSGDSVQLWPGHPCELPALALDGQLAEAGRR
jgi:NAD(P)-dependent dehydrogenase (short-subunit alcohol dehydrogenase family)